MASISGPYFLYLDRRFRKTPRNLIIYQFSTIKFAMEFSKEEMNFLDVNISQKDSVLQTDLYYKSTDIHQFLHFRPCDRYVYEKSMPYGQVLDMKKICYNKEKSSFQLEDLEHRFCSRGYKNEVVNIDIQKSSLHEKRKSVKKTRETR